MHTRMRIALIYVKRKVITKLNYLHIFFKQLLDEVEHDIMNYRNRGLCYLPKPKADNIFSAHIFSVY